MSNLKIRKEEKQMNIPIIITCRLCGSTTETRVKIEKDGHKHCKNCGNYWL